MIENVSVSLKQIFQRLKSKFDSLATVATTGSYNDLIDIPNSVFTIENVSVATTGTSTIAIPSNIKPSASLMVCHNGLLLTKDVNYIQNESSITLIGYTAAQGDVFSFVSAVIGEKTITEEEKQSIISSITKESLGLENAYIFPEGGIPSTDLDASLINLLNTISNKVEKETGKTLTSNDFTNDYKNSVEANNAARHTHPNKPLLDSLSDATVAQIGVNNTNIANIQSLIPTQATSSNQMADKAFVNSSIATNTSDFIGTFNSIAELNAYAGAKGNNDYAFVITKDTSGNTVYNRYKYNNTSWVFEYSLNNSSFTAEQWTAINSGVTQALVSQISTNASNIHNLSGSIGSKLNASNITHETWTFTLDNDSTTTKEVVLWISQ